MFDVNLSINLFFKNFFKRKDKKDEISDSFEILKEDVEEYPYELDIGNMFIFVIDEDLKYEQLKFIYTSSYPPFLKKKRMSNHENITDLFPPKVASFYIKLIHRKDAKTKRKVLAKINGVHYLIIIKPFLERLDCILLIHVPFSNITDTSLT